MTDMKTINIAGYSIEFLLNDYFGINIKATKEEIIDAAINKAYNEATMRNALLQKNEKVKNKDGNDEYQKLYKNTENVRKECNKQAKKICVGVLKWFVTYLQREYFDKNEYDELHKSVCNILVAGGHANNLDFMGYDNVYDENLESKKQDKNVGKFYELDKMHQPYFTIGNAQKWVNMTMKNLYILRGIFEKELEFIDKWEPVLHIPIDNFILYGAYRRIEDIKKNNEKVNKKCGEDVDSDYLLTCIKQVNKKESYYIKTKKEDKYVAWSRLQEYDDYNKIQKVLKFLAGDYESPIKWECEVWLYSAKLMKDKEQVISIK